MDRRFDNISSSYSRKTCPARSDGNGDAKKMRLNHRSAWSTPDLMSQHNPRNVKDTHAYYGPNPDFNEDESLYHDHRLWAEDQRNVYPDCKPGDDPSRGNSCRNGNIGNNSMELEQSPPDEGHNVDDPMDAEGASNVQIIRSSTPRKVFPASSRVILPNTGTTSAANESNSSESGFTRLSPPLNVESLQIHDRSPMQLLPHFTDRVPQAAQQVYPSHQVQRHAAPRDIDPSRTNPRRPDMRNARERLKTFHMYWDNADSEFFNTAVLVSYGFYATGFGDAVCCFECNATIANWNRDDDPKRRHLEVSPHCRFINGDPCGNRPLSPVRNSKKSPGGSSRDRRPSSRGRSQYPRSSDKFRRMMTATRRHAASVSPRPASRQPSLSSRQSSSRHSRHAVTRSNSTPPPSPMQTEAGLPQEYMNLTPELIERNNWPVIFPCENPVNASMREMSARLRTFVENPNFRSTTRLRASDRTVAEAGFYYEGNSDETRCWYCGGGLGRYQPDDDPWEEHAKYYPECEYLLQQRGPGWIHRISVQYPNARLEAQRVLPPTNPATPTQLLPNIPPNENPFGRQQAPMVIPSPQATTPTLPPIHQGQFQPTPLVMPGRRAQTRRATTPPIHIAQRGDTPPPPPPPPPRPQAVPRPMRTAAGSTIEDPQAMIQNRERLVEESMRSTPVQVVRSMGFTEDQIRSAQMRRIIGLGGPYQSSELLAEALLHPDIDPTVLEAPPQNQRPQQQQQRARGGTGSVISLNNGRIRITGGNFPRAIFGGGRGRSSIIIDGVPLHEYVAQHHAAFPNEEQQQPAPAGFPGVGTAVATTPYHTAPNPSTAPMGGETSTTNSNDVPSTSTTHPPEPTGTAEERLDALQKEYQCKICYSAKVEVLFEPCGHICACLSCGSQVTHCPMCRKRITRYIKTYHC